MATAQPTTPPPIITTLAESTSMAHLPDEDYCAGAERSKERMYLFCSQGRRAWVATSRSDFQVMMPLRRVLAKSWLSRIGSLIAYLLSITSEADGQHKQECSLILRLVPDRKRLTVRPKRGLLARNELASKHLSCWYRLVPHPESKT
jgi:hypothetical protein